MHALVTDEQLAEQFGLTVQKLHKLRLRYGWPCVKLGRWDIRFTADQVDQIVRMHSETTSAPATIAAIPGQTARSARVR